MDDDVGLDTRLREELRLIKTFLSIADSRKRQRILKLAERLADEASSEAPAGLTLAATDPSLGEASRDVTGRNE